MSSYGVNHDTAAEARAAVPTMAFLLLLVTFRAIVIPITAPPSCGGDWTAGNANSAISVAKPGPGDPGT